MYCQKCGKTIDDEAVVCVHCGAETKNFKRENEKSINIVNQSSSTTQGPKIPRVYSGVVDFFMILCTGGLWLIWMIFRPKYQ